MARELKYFYKTADGHGWLADYEPHKEEGLVEITESEWNEHIASLNVHHEPTVEQLARLEVKKQINAAKSFLSRTDYVVIKIAEAETEQEKTVLREEYASIIQERQTKRALINELEEQLNS